MPSAITSVTAGLAGAAALTALHEVARRTIPNAPRMDVVGMRALARGLRAAGAEPPDQPDLYRQTLAGDLIANSAYYALVGTGSREQVYTRGAALGLLAGLGAVLLPRRIGLDDPPHSHRAENQLMTIAWYLAGGLAAACTADWIGRLAERRGRFGEEAFSGY
jgi:hypothetical protein